MGERALADEIWYWYLTGEWRVLPPKDLMAALAVKRRLYRLLPSNPHCLEYGIPMAGIGGILLQSQGSADGVTEIAVLGNAANFCARLSSQAAA